MNDKIRNLMRSAIISVDCITGDEHLDDEISKMYIPDCFAEKFAELIVQECLDACNENNKQVHTHLGVSACVKSIKQRFGITK